MNEGAMRSDNLGELIGALSKAQAEFKPIEKNRTVDVMTRTGGTYRFRYATLDTILEAVRKPLADHGLAITQLITLRNGIPILQTLLLHQSGQWVSSEAQIIHTGANQEFGSALSYMRRYAISAILNIASQEDDDANIAEGNHIQEVVPQAPVAEKASEQKIPSLISERQLAFVHMLARERGLTHDDITNMAQNMFGVSSTKDLSRSEASQLIERLQQLPKVQPAPDDLYRKEEE